MEALNLCDQLVAMEQQNENTFFRKIRILYFIYNSITMIPNPVMTYSMATLIFQNAFLKKFYSIAQRIWVLGDLQIGGCQVII